MDQRIYREGQRLRSALLDRYRDKYANENLRCLILSPDNGAWLYGFQSWKRILDFMGINTDLMYYLDQRVHCEPYDIFIGAAAKKSLHPNAHKIQFKVGLIAKENQFITSDQCTAYDMMNIVHSKTFGFNMLITSFSQEMVDLSFPAWRNALEQEIITVPFGFDPIIYYPMDVEEQHDYFFVGTNSFYKKSDTAMYLGPIIKKYEGVLRGTNWGDHILELPPEAARHHYSSARICPNYHLSLQRELPCEVNERTYVISACGGFQLVDHPKMLDEVYLPNYHIAVANNPEDYLEEFENYLGEPELRNNMALQALRTSYEQKYDLFHRIEPIVREAILQSA